MKEFTDNFLRSLYGTDIIEQNVSGYYVANELSAVYQGMMIPIPEKHWQVFSRMVRSRANAPPLKIAVASNRTVRQLL